MRIFSIFILSISMVFIGQDIRTDAADIVTLNLSPSAGKPLFPSSVVSNDIDFIKSTDASVAYCIAFQKTGLAKMVDKRHNRLLTLNVSFFVVRFADGTRVGLWVHPDLGHVPLYCAMPGMWPAAYLICQAPCAKPCRMW